MLNSIQFSIMAATVQLIFVFLIILLVLAYLRSQRRPKGFPPGPWGFPILGHLPQLGLEPHKTAMKWKAKYGPIVGLNFGSYPCVIISDFKLVKEAFASRAFGARPQLQYNIDRTGGTREEGVIMNSGPNQQEQRRFTHRKLRDFGLGRKSLQSIILEDVLELIENLKGEIGQPIKTDCRFNAAVVNTLWTIVTGERVRQDDPQANRCIRLIYEAVHVNLFVALPMFIPSFRKWFPEWITGYKHSVRMYQPIRDFIQPYIDQHLKTHVLGEPRDFIDSYIDEMKVTTDPDSSFHPSRKFPILTTLSDLFIAGAETTSTQLVWLFLLLASYPDVQQKLADEIERILGLGRRDSRLPTLEDRKLMPYTEAAIHEVMRARSVLPLGVFHATTEDVTFHGYRIPKDTMVYGNLYAAHHDVEFWGGGPQNFRPERFLNTDESEFIRKEAFVPFSTGKRACIGESLARDEMFLFTVGLIQVFRVEVDPGSPNPSLEPTTGTVASPGHHKLVLHLRHHAT